jgi:hypothetical protein
MCSRAQAFFPTAPAHGPCVPPLVDDGTRPHHRQCHHHGSPPCLREGRLGSGHHLNSDSDEEAVDSDNEEAGEGAEEAASDAATDEDEPSSCIDDE